MPQSESNTCVGGPLWGLIFFTIITRSPYNITIAYVENASEIHRHVQHRYILS